MSCFSKKKKPRVVYDGKMYAVLIDSQYVDLNNQQYKWGACSKFSADCWTEDRAWAEQVLKRILLAMGEE